MVTSFDFTQNMEVLLIEINLNHSKFLIIGVYKPPSINNEIFLNELGDAISYYSTMYDNFLLLGDFNIPLFRKQNLG